MNIMFKNEVKDSADEDKTPEKVKRLNVCYLLVNGWLNLVSILI